MSADLDVTVAGFAPVPATAVDEVDSRRARFVGMTFACAICLTYLLVDPPSQDFASGHFRAQLASRGVHMWNNLWFGGHPLPGFGVVSPVLGGLFGVVAVSVVSVLVATWCFVLLVERWRSTTPGLPDPVVGVVLFAFGCGANLWGGRLTFLPAVMFGALALLLLQRHRPWMLAACAALCGLSSPLGALFLLVIIAAAWFARSAPRSLLVIAALATVAPIGTLIVLFPEGGWFPFTIGSLFLLTAAMVGATWCARSVPLVRWTVFTYGVVVIGAFVTKSPLGGNVVRLGWLVIGPVAALTLARHRLTIVPVIVAASLIWNAAYISMAFMPADRTAGADYYDTLVSYLATIPQPLRIEVVPTQTFAQADTLALRIDGIARGWETQLDRALNPEFYTGHLDADTYRRWLLEHAVSIVALPLGRLRDMSLDEAAVIRSRPTYLREVWENDDWQVYEVADASPLVDNGAALVNVQPEGLTIDATRTGWTTLKFRFTDLYRVAEGDACLAPTDGGWIHIFVEQPGRVSLTISRSIDAVLNRGMSSCPAGANVGVRGLGSKGACWSLVASGMSPRKGWASTLSSVAPSGRYGAATAPFAHGVYVSSKDRNRVYLLTYTCANAVRVTT